MASACSLLSEDQFLCSICLDVFTDPIAIPCGHNYCKTCITQYWDSNDVCQCPLCKTTFYTRLEFSVNKILSELADQFRKSHTLTSIYNSSPEAPVKADGIYCDVCIETKHNAVKSCLVCLASYCETHLEPHQKVSAFKRHKLIDPVKNLEDILCKKHDRPLELFCKTDQMCVCQFCTESDHRLHQIVSLKDEYEEKKFEMGKTEVEVQQMIQERQLKIQKVKHSVELSKKDADRERAHSVQVFASLISCIERGQAELIGVIEEKQKTTEEQAEGFMREMEQEITELKKTSSELKQLLHTEDYLHLLQNFRSINTPPPIKDWTKVNVNQSSYGETVRTAVAQLEKTLSQEMEKLRDADTELRRIQQYVVDVTLDPDTAHCKLILSEDGKQVNVGDMKKLRDNTERFSAFLSVLGKESYSSGRFYYEVQVKGKTDWDLGVASESINRKGTITLNPSNGYWTIVLRRGIEYKAAAGPSVLLPVREKLQKVGVFVDYEEGLVSFYNVETRVHIYSFTGCTFADNLYPFFSPGVNNDGKNSAALIVSPVNHID